MTYIVLKFVISAAVLVAVSEIARRSSFLGGLLASLPLTSLLAIVWLYRDTGDVEKVSALSMSIFWLVLPSMPFLLALAILLRKGINFHAALLSSIAIMALSYGLMIVCFHRFGLKL